MVEIIDVENAVVGRIASFAAKKALLGEKIIIVNADKAVITGDPKVIIKKYNERFDVGTPHHGPKWPKRPDAILRRIIRGMLPKNWRGRQALKNVEVYIGIPEEYKEKETKIEKFNKKELETKYITLGELSKRLGGKWL